MHEEKTPTLVYFIYKLTGIPEIIIISALLIILVGFFLYYATRNLNKIPSKVQVILEMIFSGFNNFVKQIVGKDGEKYAPLIGSFFIYILLMNLIGLIPGMAPPTYSLNTTLALAIVSFFAVHYFAIRKNGIVKYLKHYVAGVPIWLAPLMFVVHVISELAKPFSLAIRLFANMFSEKKAMYMLILFLPVLAKYIVPIPTYFLMLCIGLVVCVLQALIFSLLSAIYLSVMLGDEHH